MNQSSPNLIWREQVPMARHLTWRAGGKARNFFIPLTLEALQQKLSHWHSSQSLLWLGAGSNLLIRDGGIEQTVIAYRRALGWFRIAGQGVFEIGAGVPCARIARRTADLGWSGCEYMIGIPGLLGGALAMNAGAHGTQTWDHVEAVQVMDRCGQIYWRDANEFQPGYRHVSKPDNEWFIGARLVLKQGMPTSIHDRITQILSTRRKSQPIGQASAGSVFRNPPGHSAGKLIEAAGLKGRSFHQAQISPHHANFIINHGGASADAIEFLIHLVIKEVNRTSGIDLQPEVHIMGLSAEQRTKHL